MKIKKLNNLFQNNLFVFILSLFISVVIWLLVVINVSPQTTRVIKDVKVTIDNAVPSQFGLEVFGESEFTVDVTVKGKKYQISNLSADDIVTTAITTYVDSPGHKTLQLKAEPVSENASYVISSVSLKTIDVYFDTPKSVEFQVEPEIITKNGLPVVEDGFTCGEPSLSENLIKVTGPSKQVDRIKRAVAKCVLDTSLDSNLSFETDIVLLDENNQSDFDYIKMSANKTVIAIPVYRVKTVSTAVNFKNVPNSYISSPLSYIISPKTEAFNIFVDEYEKTLSYNVGTVDFKTLSPTNNKFVFPADKLPVAEGGAQEFTVTVDMSGFSQEYISISKENIRINNADYDDYNITQFPNYVVVVGPESELKGITKDKIYIEIDASQVDVVYGEAVKIPALVTVDSDTCWVYGTYDVEIAF